MPAQRSLYSPEVLQSWKNANAWLRNIKEIENPPIQELEKLYPKGSSMLGKHASEIVLLRLLWTLKAVTGALAWHSIDPTPLNAKLCNLVLIDPNIALRGRGEITLCMLISFCHRVVVMIVLS